MLLINETPLISNFFDSWDSNFFEKYFMVPTY